MKKKLFFLFLILLVSILTIPSALAEEYIVLNTNKYFRDVPGGRALTEAVADGVLLSGMKVVVLSKDGEKGNGCNNAWYKVKYNDTVGYICSSDQVVQETVEVDPNGSFEQEMLAKGFPSSYLPYLKPLHQKHENWIFTPLATGLDFNEALNNETIGEMSLVNGSDESLRARDEYGNFIPSKKEAGWYVASRDTVSYYMDPRNFLSEEYVFMFENLHYNAAIHTRDSVQGVVSGTFLNTNEYLNYFMEAAEAYNVSPVYLASRVRQEKGVNGGIGTDGAPFTFAIDEDCMSNYADRSSWNARNNCGTGETYQGIYNFYNIGAYGTYMSPVIRGLIWAKGGFDSSATGYNRPWNTKEKAILGGAESIANNYISVNQHTLYLQKFNVSPDALNSTYTHQYMANIKAHAQEAYSIYQSYKENGLMNQTFEFLIPVYQNMPGENDSIEEEDPQPVEPSVPVEAPSVNEAIVASGYKLNNYYISNIGAGVNISTFEGRLKNVYSNMQIVGFQDKNGNNKSGNIGTGDTIIISNGSNQDAYTAIIYGDNSGDGEITILDLLRTQKYLLGYSNLSDHELLASDVSKDGMITILDLLRLQKALLGYNEIEQ